MPAASDRPLAPTRVVAAFRRVATPLWLLAGIAATLEIRGRVSGATRRVAFIPVKFEGNVYAVAWGGVTDWALNLRAAGCGELGERRHKQVVRAIEVTDDERASVIATYMKRVGPLRRDFQRRPEAHDHPVFRLEPTDEGSC